MKTLLKISLLAVAALMLTFCCNCGKEKGFDAKATAKEHTAKLTEAVGLDKAQQKQVYALFLERAKKMEAAMEQMKASCPKGEGKACCKEGKAECKGQCPEGKPCCKEGNAECKGQCPEGKPCCKEGNAECKGQCPKGGAKCGMHAHHGGCPMMNREDAKAFKAELDKILTDEQKAKLAEQCPMKGGCKEGRPCCKEGGECKGQCPDSTKTETETPAATTEPAQQAAE